MAGNKNNNIVAKVSELSSKVESINYNSRVASLLADIKFGAALELLLEKGIIDEQSYMNKVQEISSKVGLNLNITKPDSENTSDHGCTCGDECNCSSGDCECVNCAVENTIPAYGVTE